MRFPFLTSSCYCPGARPLGPCCLQASRARTWTFSIASASLSSCNTGAFLLRKSGAPGCCVLLGFPSIPPFPTFSQPSQLPWSPPAVFLPPRRVLCFVGGGLSPCSQHTGELEFLGSGTSHSSHRAVCLFLGSHFTCSQSP